MRRPRPPRGCRAIGGGGGKLGGDGLVSFTVRPLYPLYRRLGGSQSWSGRFEEEKRVVFLCRQSNPDFSVVQPVLWSLYRLSYPLGCPACIVVIIQTAIPSLVQPVSWSLYRLSYPLGCPARIVVIIQTELSPRLSSPYRGHYTD
jgi:hypothetical protein